MAKLSKILKELIIRYPFYGIFCLGLRKEIVKGDHPIKTAGVGPNGLNFTLYVNEDFWNKLTELAQLQLLIHELRHLCLFHVGEWFKAENHHNMNVAMDVVVNSDLKELWENGIHLEKLEKILEKKLEKNRGSWYYYGEIQQFAKEHPEKCMPDFSCSGDHSLWPKDMSEAEKKLYENQIKSRLKETADQIKKQGGTIPGELTDIIQALNKPPVYNWRKHFRQLVGNSISSEIQLTRMRPSKRFPDARGIRLKRKPSIMVAVDTSGSISNNDLQEFFSEINHIYKTGVDVDVVEFDTKIEHISKYSGKAEYTIHGRGGSDVTETVNYYNEHKNQYSSLVIFTDGYLINFNLPVCQSMIWVITKDGDKRRKYQGKTIFIP